MRWGVVQFPGSNDERDTVYALGSVLGDDVRLIWHGDSALGDVDAVVLPGGFSYGDYLRCGALARFSPVMGAVAEFAKDGGPVLGICNGFQVLCEAGLLPGALVRNRELKFQCKHVELAVENRETAFSRAIAGERALKIPIKNGEGCYVAAPEVLEHIEAEGRVVFRYKDSPNGSLGDIAGVTNSTGNVVGLMPHPEHAVDALAGGIDGRGLFESAKGWERAA